MASAAGGGAGGAAASGAGGDGAHGPLAAAAKAAALKAHTQAERARVAITVFDTLRVELKVAIEAKEAAKAHGLYERLGRALVSVLECLDDGNATEGSQQALGVAKRLPETLTPKLIERMNPGPERAMCERRWQLVWYAKFPTRKFVPIAKPTSEPIASAPAPAPAPTLATAPAAAAAAAPAAAGAGAAAASGAGRYAYRPGSQAQYDDCKAMGKLMGCDEELTNRAIALFSASQTRQICGQYFVGKALALFQVDTAALGAAWAWDKPNAAGAVTSGKYTVSAAGNSDADVFVPFSAVQPAIAVAWDDALKRHVFPDSVV